MANYCNYEVHIRGNKKAALMIYTLLPELDYKEISKESGSENNYVIHTVGCCKWEIDYNCKDVYNGEPPCLDCFTEEQIRNNQFEEKDVPYWNTTLQIKSKLFSCEIEVHSWSEESGFDSFESYKNGEMVKNDFIDYEFYLWDKDEYPDYEEFCEDYDIDSEEIPEELFENSYDNIFQYGKSLTVTFAF